MADSLPAVGGNVLLQGYLKIRRVSIEPVSPPKFGHNISTRWGSRYFVLSDTHLTQKSSSVEDATQLDLLNIARVRWPTPQEARKGFSLSNSLRKLVLGDNNRENVDATASYRFMIDTLDSHIFMLECDSLQDSGKWFEALEDRVYAAKRKVPDYDELDPLVLVKDQSTMDINEVYDLGVTLGSGMSGVVKRITRRADGKQFAMKTIQLEKLTVKQLQNLKNEINILKILDHPHICRLYEIYTEPKKCVRLVMELCDGGELFDRLHEKKRFGEAWVARLVYKMVGVLRYLHENHIAHRDLKLENWLFRSKEDDDEIVLIDFGLSYKYQHLEHMKKKVGTSYYVAPEVLKGDYMGVQADVWSLGVIVYMLLGGCAPFDGKDDEEILRNVAAGKRPNYETGAWRKISELGKQFIQGLLTVDPKKRLTAEEALLHPWLANEEVAGKKFEFDETMYANMIKFSEFSSLKRIAMEVVAFGLSHHEIKNLTDVFQSMDSDHNGYVSFAGLKRELTRRFPISDEELEKLFAALDDDHSGRLHVNEFVAATMQFKYYFDENMLLQAFRVMDQDNTGYITVGDLKQLLGKHVDDARALEMIKMAEQQVKSRSYLNLMESNNDDDNSDEDMHKLSFQEFLEFVRRDAEEEIQEIGKTSELLGI